jgi:sortase A
MRENSHSPYDGVSNPKSSAAMTRRRRRFRPFILLLDLVIVAMVLTGLYLIFEPYYVHWMQDQTSNALLDEFDHGDGKLVIDPDKFVVPGEDDENILAETTPEETTAPSDGTTAEPAATPTPVPDEVVITAIGRIKIPVIDVNRPILEGATVYTLRYGIGHYTHSAGLGQPGLCILLGHRSYTYGRNFNRLGEVTLGDKIVIDTKEYRYTYKVSRIVTVLPNDLMAEFNAHVEGSQIMLVTCTPIRVATHRLLVQGILIKTEIIN